MPKESKEESKEEDLARAPEKPKKTKRASKETPLASKKKTTKKRPTERCYFATGNPTQASVIENVNIVVMDLPKVETKGKYKSIIKLIVPAFIKDAPNPEILMQIISSKANEIVITYRTIGGEYRHVGYCNFTHPLVVAEQEDYINDGLADGTINPRWMTHHWYQYVMHYQYDKRPQPGNHDIGMEEIRTNELLKYMREDSKWYGKFYSIRWYTEKCDQ